METLPLRPKEYFLHKTRDLVGAVNEVVVNCRISLKETDVQSTQQRENLSTYSALDGLQYRSLLSGDCYDSVRVAAWFGLVAIARLSCSFQPYCLVVARLSIYSRNS